MFQFHPYSFSVNVIAFIYNFQILAINVIKYSGVFLQLCCSWIYQTPYSKHIYVTWL